MSAVICPTVLAETPHDYREQMERVEAFASRIQVDLMDGDFAPARSIDPAQVWLPEDVPCDLHVMFRRPLEYLETLVSLRPHMVIFHAEAAGDLKAGLLHLQKLGIKAGVALLKPSDPEDYRELITVADHVLLFSGDLGHFGGEADLAVLNKVAEVKTINSGTELGWDGGANTANVRQLADGGVDVINVGGAIQRADDPAAAYQELVASLAA